MCGAARNDDLLESAIKKAPSMETEMTAKEKAIKVFENLPENSSTEDILEALCFHEKIERGLADVEAGRVISHEDAKKRLARWLEK
jgi:predicted transcriptional regulator